MAERRRSSSASSSDGEKPARALPARSAKVKAAARLSDQRAPRKVTATTGPIPSHILVGPRRFATVKPESVAAAVESRSNDDEGPPKKRKKGKAIRKKAAKAEAGVTVSTGRQLHELPWDILVEIGRHIDPKDALQLARTSKALRQLLMRRISASFWLASLSHICDAPPAIPPDLSIPAFLSLAFENDGCDTCASPYNTVFYKLRIRLCSACEQQLVPEWELEDGDSHIPLEASTLCHSVITNVHTVQHLYDAKRRVGWDSPTVRRFFLPELLFWAEQLEAEDWQLDSDNYLAREQLMLELDKEDPNLLSKWADRRVDEMLRHQQVLASQKAAKRAAVLERLEVERPDMNLYTIELAMKAETSWPSQTLDDDIWSKLLAQCDEAIVAHDERVRQEQIAEAARLNKARKQQALDNLAARKKQRTALAHSHLREWKASHLPDAPSYSALTVHDLATLSSYPTLIADDGDGWWHISDRALDRADERLRGDIDLFLARVRADLASPPKGRYDGSLANEASLEAYFALPTSVYRCSKCEGLDSFPELLDHACFGTQRSPWQADRWSHAKAETELIERIFEPLFQDEELTFVDLRDTNVYYIAGGDYDHPRRFLELAIQLPHLLGRSTPYRRGAETPKITVLSADEKEALDTDVDQATRSAAVWSCTNCSWDQAQLMTKNEAEQHWDDTHVTVHMKRRWFWKTDTAHALELRSSRRRIATVPAALALATRQIRVARGLFDEPGEGAGDKEDVKIKAEEDTNAIVEDEDGLALVSRESPEL